MQTDEKEQYMNELAKQFDTMQASIEEMKIRAEEPRDKAKESFQDSIDYLAQQSEKMREAYQDMENTIGSQWERAKDEFMHALEKAKHAHKSLSQ